MLQNSYPSLVSIILNPPPNMMPAATSTSFVIKSTATQKPSLLPSMVLTFATKRELYDQMDHLRHESWPSVATIASLSLEETNLNF